MSVLDDLGLKPESGTPEAPQTPPEPEPTPEPVTPESPEEPVEVPEGAENPDAVAKLIKEERATARAANARAREAERKLQEIEDAGKPVEERLLGATKRAEAADLKALKLEVAYDLSLPKTLALRLHGTTEQELRTDAETLLAEVGTKPKPQLPGLDGGPKPPPPAPSDPQVAHNHWLANVIHQKRTGQQ